LNLLHVTYDLRDRLNRDKTTAVSNLIKESSSFSKVNVIDLVRVPYLWAEKLELRNDNHLELNTFGFPYGLFFKIFQNRVAKKILNSEKSGIINFLPSDLIHTHKLTFDGSVGFKLAQKYSIPLITTIRQTDITVLNKKPGLKKHFKQIIKKCEKIIYLIPQVTVKLNEEIGDGFFEEHVKHKLCFLPNIVERKVKHSEAEIEPSTFVTVLRMNKESVKRKNIKKLLLAFKELNEEKIKLKIIGDGDYMYKVKRWVNDFNLNDRIIFTGSVKNDRIDEHYAKAAAFLLPSISESFGIVLALYLYNGTPIMYSKNRLGFDGVFIGVGVGVEPLSVESIVKGIKDLLLNGNNYRKRISELEDNSAFNIFSSQYIKNKYHEIVSMVVK